MDFGAFCFEVFRFGVQSALIVCFVYRVMTSVHLQSVEMSKVPKAEVLFVEEEFMFVLLVSLLAIDYLKIDGWLSEFCAKHRLEGNCD